jgi:hypothetical protein
MKVKGKMSMSEMAKVDKAVEKKAREQLLGDVMEYLIDKGYPCDRVTDYGTLGVQVNDTIFTVKFVIPVRYDKEGNEKWNLDDAIEEYEIRVAKDKQKEADKAARDALSKAKQAKRKAADEEAAATSEE